jgi:flagellar biosynthesis GTPase FlhF
MRIRQFTAPSTAEALRELRSSLGDEALVLSTHSEPGCVVITAAVDADAGAATAERKEGRAMASDELPSRELPGSAGLQFDLALIRTQLEQLGRRVHRMDRVLLDIGGDAAGLGPEGRDVVERLLSRGLAPQLATPVALSFERGVAAACSHADALRASLLEHVAVASPSAAPVEALIGPTGSGKTTTIAKLAARALLAGEAPPALIAADTERIGAVDELAAYARLFGCALRVARDADEMADALAALAPRGRVLIDTAGLAGDPSAAAEVETLLAAAGAALGVTAVVSATASLRSLQRAWPQLARLGARRCVVTRLDECDELGTACTWLAEVGLPIAWLGTGRRVAEDLSPARGEDLVRWLTAA